MKKFESLDEIQRKAEEFKLEVRKSVVTAIVAAFGFVVALFWRDAIQDGIDTILEVLNLTQESYYYKIVAAVIVTVIAVIGISVVSKWGEKKPTQSNNK